MRIVVEGSDIKDGERCGVQSCPVALAVGRAIKARFLSASFEVRVAQHSVTIFSDGGQVERGRFTLFEPLPGIINEYDRGNGMEPFEFDILGLRFVFD